MENIAALITPVIFIGHGNPMNAIENNKYTASWIEIVKSIPKPKAILVISAHWETEQSENLASKLKKYQNSNQANGTKITSNKKPKTIHDFYGFPKELYDIQYNPTTDINLVNHIQELVPEIKTDDSWGLDHGAWSVLTHIYPKADIPTLQLSIDKNKTPQEHYELARKLKQLRKEGVLILGSGNIVHNLRMAKWRGEQAPYPWAIEFNNAIKSAILSKEHDKIVNYQNLNGARESVPTSEHFIPLIYILGLQDEDGKAEIFAEDFVMGSVSMMSVIVR